MTINDAIMLARMLIDDSRDDYIDNTTKLNIMYEAQLRYIEKAYTEGNERVLLPLYRTTVRQATGLVVLANDNTIPLYPRLCRVFEASADPDANGYYANYIEPELYFNYDKPNIATGQLFPRTVSYTILSQWSAAQGRYLKYFHFNGPATAVAQLTYIKTPIPLLNGRTFETAAESHPAIVAMAVEMMNDIDVSEQQRSVQQVPPGATVTMMGGLTDD